MDENEWNHTLEELCGGVDRAFRLLYLWRDAVAAASGNCFTLSPHKQVDRDESFRRHAERAGYSKEAIDYYMSGVK